jgi:hypothetical protein
MQGSADIAGKGIDCDGIRHNFVEMRQDKRVSLNCSICSVNSLLSLEGNVYLFSI